MEPKEYEVIMPPLERRKRGNITILGVIALVAFFLLCVSFGFWLAGFFSNPFPDNKKDNPEAVYKSNGVLNILLMGIDQRKDEPARADTLILVSLNLDKKQINLLSVPRDTRVEIPGKGFKRKINYAHAAGGADLTVKTVEKFLQVPVHYYVETNFEGFSNMIDILGGVTINVEQRMYKPLEGIDLQAGLQKLKGHDALSYVRWRSDGKGDIGRIARQQKFFQALSDQATQFSTIWKIPQLLGELSKQVKTDLPLKKMILLANKFKDIKDIDVNTYMVPGTPDEIHYGGSYWIADRQELDKILKNIYNSNDQKNDLKSGTN